MIYKLLSFIENSARLKKIKKLFRYLTSPLRLLPDFIIIGTPKGGTTSLYNYLIQHPNIYSAYRKEVDFFIHYYNFGINWYKSFFPLSMYKFIIKILFKKKFITGEASPSYMFDPNAPRRVSALLPKIKLIILLRNPVERAYSHYNMQVRRGWEPLSFEASIQKEQERIGCEIEKALKNENYNTFLIQLFSYLSKGVYIKQIKNWVKYFSKQQFLILKSEDFYDNPKNTLKKVYDFLNLPNFELNEYVKYNYGIYDKINNKTKEKLIEYYSPYNKKLNQYLNMNFNWESNDPDLKKK